MSRASQKTAAEPNIQDLLQMALAHLRANEPNRALACLTAYPSLTHKHPFACYLAGLIYVNTGNDDAALSHYARALALDPTYAEALEARGRLLQRMKRFAEAIADLVALLRVKPATADILYNLGTSYEGDGHKDDALACYDRVLKIAPGHSPALAAKALILYDGGHIDRALEALQASVAADPSNETAWYNFGAILASLDQHEKAVESFNAALRIAPAYGKALHGAAHSLHKLKRLDEALAVCAVLLKDEPANFDALFLKANILYDCCRFFEALAAFKEVLKLNPKHVGALNNCGGALRELGRFPEAAALFDTALNHDPGCVEALLGRGIIAFKSMAIETSLVYFERAIKADPAAATAYCGRGLSLQHLGRIEEARRDFEHALTLDPDLLDAHAALSALQLLLGEFEAGFEKNEYRLLMPNYFKTKRQQRFPAWNGEDISGKKLLVINEAAHGDAIMLARYFPMLAERGIDATVECLPHMVALLGSAQGVRLVTKIDPALHFDYETHLFSLPHVFKTRLDTVPNRVPYLSADERLKAKWADRLGNDGFKIGVAWQGNPDPAVDIARAAPLALFGSLAGIPGCRFISLQKKFGLDQIERCGFTLETLGNDFDAGPDAFVDTAAVIANLDLVVSVDTSIAHLAGALGRPVWVALKKVPEWRWMLDRDDSPWYPTMRLFRQRKMGDWEPVFADMAHALPPLVARKKAASEPLLIPAAVGELIDKLTILEIKAARIADPGKLANVKRELTLLNELKTSRGFSGKHLDSLSEALKRTNATLWDIEDEIRDHERRGDFGPDFVALARSVYHENDKRAALKREINMAFGSAIVEEKHYSSY